MSEKFSAPTLGCWTALNVLLFVVALIGGASLGGWLIIFVAGVVVWAVCRGLLAMGRAAATPRLAKPATPRTPTQQEEYREAMKRYQQNIALIRQSVLDEDAKSNLLKEEKQVLEDRLRQILR
jgi:hypothetical protein